MDHLERFRGKEEAGKERVAQKIATIVELSEQFVPSNFLELIQPINGVMDIELNWVKVKDPTSCDDVPVLEVMPTLSLADEDTCGVEGPGIYSISLIGKLPDGNPEQIGDLAVHCSSRGFIDSCLLIGDIYDKGPKERVVYWSDPDGEIFLDLLQSALGAQDSSRSASFNYKL